MATPVIGQPVQFNSTKGAAEGELAVHAALVTAVKDDGTIDLQVFGPFGAYQREGVAPEDWQPLPKAK